MKDGEIDNYEKFLVEKKKFLKRMCSHFSNSFGSNQ